MSRVTGVATGVSVVVALFALGVGCGSSSDGASAGGAAGQSANGGSGNGGAAAGTAGAVGGTAGAGGGSAGAAGTGNVEMAACSAYATAYCSLLLSCQTEAFHDVYGTMDNCTGGRIGACMDRFAAPGAQTTPAMVSACAAVLVPANGCTTVRSACVFQGTLGDATACAYDAQCQSKLCKVAAYGAACGVCGEPAPKGDPCFQSNGCAPGLQCGKDVCVSSLPLGSACDPAQFDCAFPNLCSKGTCQPPPGVNQPCDQLYGGCTESDDAECLDNVCQKLVWNGVGGDCDSNKGILCLGGLDCNPVGGPGKCEVRAPKPPTLAADCK